MRRLRPLCLLVASLVLVPAAIAASGPSLRAPRNARIGATVYVRARGLAPARYTLALVADKRPGPRAACLARMATSRDGVTAVNFKARIPKHLSCYEGAHGFLGRISTTPGAYHLAVGSQTAPAGFSTARSFVRKPILLRR